MRDSLTLKEVAFLLPMSGAGAQLLDVADILRARAGHVQQCLFRLKDAGVVRLEWERDTGARWWRLDGIAIPELTVRPGATPKKPDEAIGNVGLHDGGISKKPSPYALTMYGEDTARARPPLASVQALDKITADLAKAYARVAFTRAEDVAKGTATPVLALLALEVDALTDAAEMVRARITRLTKEALAKSGATERALSASTGPP